LVVQVVVRVGILGALVAQQAVVNQVGVVALPAFMAPVGRQETAVRQEQTRRVPPTVQVVVVRAVMLLRRSRVVMELVATCWFSGLADG
jgi:hypothetical protein